MTPHNESKYLLRIGSVSAVRGSVIEVSVDADKNEASLLHQGEIIDNVTVGSHIVIHRGYRRLVAKVEEEFLLEDSHWIDDSYRRDIERYKRILKASLLGSFTDNLFVRGRTISPLIGNTAYIATHNEVNRIYNPKFRSTAAPDYSQIEIGSLAADPSIRFNLDINGVFASHLGIFGNTGSGKSYTLTQLYTKLVDRLIQNQDKPFPENSKFVIFDLNGEYGENPEDNVLCAPEYKEVFCTTSGQKIPLSPEILKNPDFWYTVLEATEKTQRPFIDRALKYNLTQSELRKKTKQILDELFKAANPKDIDPTLIFKFLKDIHNLLDSGNTNFTKKFEDFHNFKYNSTNNNYYFKEPNGKGLYANQNEFSEKVENLFNEAFSEDFEPITSPLQSINISLHLQFYTEVSRGFSNISHLRPLINRLQSRVDLLDRTMLFDSNKKSTKGIHIINLQQSTLEERKLIPLIVTRSLYKEHKKLYKKSMGFLNIIIDEAHNLLSYESSQESETWRNTRLEMFEEILKEGRKFGVFVTLASQRPYDISPTITSQLHHYFLHQLVNPKDLEAISNAVSYLDRKSFAELPSLPQGTCIISGTSVQVPAIVAIDKLPEEGSPSNETIDLNKHWNLIK